MSDKALRAGLIRLAHENPSMREHLLPIIKACGVEAPMVGKFEEGKPADPTENMSPEDAAEWKKQTELNKDKFKGAGKKDAGCEKLPEGGMRDNCEKKKEEGGKADEGEKKEASNKTAGMAVVRRTTTIAVRVLTSKPDGKGGIVMAGQMSLDFGGDVRPDAVRFAAVVSEGTGTYTVTSFQTQKAVSGGGAEVLLGVLRAALQEALTTKGRSLLGAPSVPEPVL